MRIAVLSKPVVQAGLIVAALLTALFVALGITAASSSYGNGGGYMPSYSHSYNYGAPAKTHVHSAKLAGAHYHSKQTGHVLAGAHYHS